MVLGWMLSAPHSRKKGSAIHICPLYPKVKAFPKALELSVSFGRADYMTDQVPDPAARDAGRVRVWSPS